MSEDANNVTGENITIKTSDGTASVNPELLRGYLKEGYDVLSQMDTLKDEFKDIVEAAADGTKLPKKIVSKYLKARYKASTKADKEVGDVFAKLDEVVDA